MREGIHPAYYQAKVVCNCGNEFVTGSTKEDIHVEICSRLHRLVVESISSIVSTVFRHNTEMTWNRLVTIM